MENKTEPAKPRQTPLKMRLSAAVSGVVLLSVSFGFLGFRATALKKAVERGDVARVAVLLKITRANPNVDVCTAYAPAQYSDWVPPFLRRIPLPSVCAETLSLVSFASGKPSAAQMLPELLKAGANPNPKRSLEHPALQITVIRQDKKATGILLRAGANPNVSAFGNTPLGAAAALQNLPMARLLLEHGANPNQPVYDDYLPIFAAIENDDLPLVKLLVAHGASLSRVSNYNDTPLQRAAATDALRCLNYFLDKGANINERNENGMTALMEAAEAGKVDAVRLLLNHGANPNLREANGQTALDFNNDFAPPKQGRQIARLLRRYGGRLGNPHYKPSISGTRD